MDSQGGRPRIEPTREAMTAAANDREVIACRYELARFSAKELEAAGTELHVVGHLIGTDRVQGSSPFGHGNDETVAVSVLLRIAGQLISASADLFADGRQYAAAALLRQMVEIEYLAWAFDVRDGDGERWLRSDQHERQEFFKPAKRRAAAQGKFRGKDYGLPLRTWWPSRSTGRNSFGRRLGDRSVIVVRLAWACRTHMGSSDWMGSTE